MFQNVLKCTQFRRKIDFNILPIPETGGIEETTDVPTGGVTFMGEIPTGLFGNDGGAGFGGGPLVVAAKLLPIIISCNYYNIVELIVLC